MCGIIMFIFGIIALVRGRFLLTRAKEVRGWPARIIGILLMAPFPLSFLVGIVLGAVFVALGKKVDAGDKDFLLAAQIAGFAVVAICLIAAIAVALIFSQPIRISRPEPRETALPHDYDEPFQPRGREDSESQDIKGGTSRPKAPPDDRVQH